MWRACGAPRGSPRAAHPRARVPSGRGGRQPRPEPPRQLSNPRVWWQRGGDCLARVSRGLFFLDVFHTQAFGVEAFQARRPARSRHGATPTRGAAKRDRSAMPTAPRPQIQRSGRRWRRRVGGRRPAGARRTARLLAGARKFWDVLAALQIARSLGPTLGVSGGMEAAYFRSAIIIAIGLRPKPLKYMYSMRCAAASVPGQRPSNRTSRHGRWSLLVPQRSARPEPWTPVVHAALHRSNARVRSLWG